MTCSSAQVGARAAAVQGSHGRQHTSGAEGLPAGSLGGVSAWAVPACLPALVAGAVHFPMPVETQGNVLLCKLLPHSGTPFLHVVHAARHRSDTASPPPPPPPVPQTSCFTLRLPPPCWMPTPPSGASPPGTTTASRRGTAGTSATSSALLTSRVGPTSLEGDGGAWSGAHSGRRAHAPATLGGEQWPCMGCSQAPPPCFEGCFAGRVGILQRAPLHSPLCPCRAGLDDEARAVAGAGPQVAAGPLGEGGNPFGATRRCRTPGGACQCLPKSALPSRDERAQACHDHGARL